MPVAPESLANLQPFTEGNQFAAGHGPPEENTNAQRHGLRTLKAASRTATLPRLPDIKITRQGHKLRRWLEAATLDAHGRITVPAELYINTATRHELAALLIARWLRLKGDDMSTSERLQYLTALGKESDLRDRAVEKLYLAEDADTIMAGLYGSQISPLDTMDDEP